MRQKLNGYVACQRFFGSRGALTIDANHALLILLLWKETKIFISWYVVGMDQLQAQMVYSILN